MQTLKFESSWDKALSNKDRKAIEATFIKTNTFNNERIQISPLWQAVNYKNELLVTVLLHNFTNHPYSFNETILGYTEHSKLLAKHTFTIPALNIPPKTSMPWTCIFPLESLADVSVLQNGILTVIR
ncbi:SLAP domain-containing protein [Bacillus sp. FJAT-22090]|uniref:SLAP domain-containing protein n=1 Tax=Bacillus sp. FJAT-22090 TaxID=1581038 RepID=UPI0011A99C87|nr:SLAP domain-containing protein [Bacillus sp. FJAT-22090]